MLGAARIGARVSPRTEAGADDCRFGGKRTNPGGASGGAVQAKVDDGVNEELGFLTMKNPKISYPVIN